MEVVKIHTEYINLGQFLKLKGFIANGGEAKIAVLDMEIKVNSVVETRRGRKLYPGDTIKIKNRSFLIQKGVYRG